MAKLNIESIGADWCIDDSIKFVLDNNGGSFYTGMITIPENKLPQLKGTLTIDNTEVNLSEAYSLGGITRFIYNSEILYRCNFIGNELPSIEIILDSSFKPIDAIIQDNSGGTETEE